MSPRAPHRFFFSGRLDHSDGGVVALSAEESRHLARVLRLREGARIDLFDASGAAYGAEVAQITEGVAYVRLLNRIETDAPGTRELNLAVALLKRRAMDWMIEKLSELGVASLQVLLAGRGVGLPDVRPHEDTPDRWDRLALAAAKQCGRNSPMVFLPPMSVVEWLERPRPPAHAAFAHPAPGAQSIGQWLAGLSGAAEPIWVAIGPEGGWSPDEADAFERAGFTPVGLGELTLRAETAALAAAAVCRLHGP